MAKITPFKAIRPVRDKVHLVATRPYYSYKKNVLKAKLEDNPFTFLHIINPESAQPFKTKGNSPERFELVSERYSEFLEEKILIKDEDPHLYIYRQSKDGHQYMGFIGGASVEEYNQDKIKKHEATITKREAMFTNYLDIVGYNAEPVLLSYPHNPNLEHLLLHYTQFRPEYEFTTTDRITHELWILDKDAIDEVQEIFERIPSIYIADGHHRSASSVGLHNARIKENRSTFENEKAFLAYFIDEERLKIVEFNRFIKSLGNVSEEQLLSLLDNHFIVEKKESNILPKQEHHFTMCLKGTWYLLKCKPDILTTDHPVKSLDAQILTDYVLEPILGIKDLKTDTNIDFVSGVEPLSKMEKAIIKEKYDVGFFLYPVTMNQVKKVADNQLIMPPKSTWVEPKLRSGLTIYNINE